MNQFTPNKERKQSLSRLSVVSHSNKHLMVASDIKRNGTSLNKKHAEIQQICQDRRGKYLVGWGNIPFMTQQNDKTQIINKDVIDFACGQEHLVFVNNCNQAFGMGKNQFGELGSKDALKNRQVIEPIFQNYKIQKVFCTQFCTFFITVAQQLYSCGLNNRGQLGIATNKQRICQPVLVQSLSHKIQKQMLDKKQSRSKISSVYYQQLKRSISSKEFIQEQRNFDYKSNSLLQSYQSIVDLQGGPFHTVVLTNKGRIFYTGNLYKSESLLNDQFTHEFIELNTTKFGKIVSIRSHLTGFCFCNIEGKLYMLGHFGEHLFNQPELIDKLQVSSYDVNDKGIYAVGLHGEAYFIDISKSRLQVQKIAGSTDIKYLFCGLDYTILVSKSNGLLGLGDNSHNQLGYSISKKIHTSLINLQFSFKPQEMVNLKCSNNYVLSLVSNANFITNVNDHNDVLKLKDLQRQNKIIKELLCNKNKKNVKIQTEKESKFQFNKPINARTFDTSMQIPFEEIKLGKQISEGGYGIIYKATWRKTVVAVKIFKIQKENQNAVRDFISQCHAMEALRHPNIVMFLGACTKPPHFAIVLEYCEGGTLWSLLQKQQELNWEERRKLALDIAKGMNYLHQRPIPILHRDLKSLNVLLDGNKRVKLADFGWTKGLENYMTGKIGTYQWMAPEVISGFQYSQKADIYSFGIILWQIASREAPYRNIPGPQVAQQVMTKELRPQIPKKTPPCFSNLIQRCWSRNPSSRPSFSALINELQEMSFN